MPCCRFVTASQDQTAKVWDANTRRCVFTLSGHTRPVTCVKWGGDGFIHTSSRDGSIMVWDAKVCRQLPIQVCIVLTFTRMSTACSLCQATPSVQLASSGVGMASYTRPFGIIKTSGASTACYMSSDAARPLSAHSLCVPHPKSTGKSKNHMTPLYDCLRWQTNSITQCRMQHMYAHTSKQVQLILTPSICVRQLELHVVDRCFRSVPGHLDHNDNTSGTAALYFSAAFVHGMALILVHTVKSSFECCHQKQANCF